MTGAQPVAIPGSDLLFVWDVEGEGRRVCGVTSCPDRAKLELIAALNEMPGRGFAREARLTTRGEYAYGRTVLKARRKPGQNGVRVSGI